MSDKPIIPVGATIHELKTVPAPFQAVLDERKRFEYRKNDRGFQGGDVLHLREWLPDMKIYTGREMYVLVTYMLEGGLFDVPVGYAVLSIERMT